MKLTLGKKLGMSFGGILALMVLSSVLTYLKASAIRESQDHAFNVRIPSVAACKDLQRDLNQTQSKGRQIILAGADSTRRDPAKKLFDGTWNDIAEHDTSALDGLAPHWSLQANRDRYAAVKRQLADRREAPEAAIKRAAGGERDAVALAGNDFADKGTAINELIKKSLGDLANSHSELLVHEAEEMKAEGQS